MGYERRQMRVVIAHGCPETRARFALVLAGVGHHATEVATAEETIEHCRAEAPDVAVVHVGLTAGAEEPSLLGSLKSDANAYRTAVVLLEQPDLDLVGAVARCGAASRTSWSSRSPTASWWRAWR